MISGIDYGKGNDESCAITFVSPEYIEQLQQENQRLKDRIEKAIEYINKIELDNYDIYTANILLDRNDDLLEILKGE